MQLEALLLPGWSGGGGLVAKLCPTLVTPWTVACLAPLSLGFSRQEHWSGGEPISVLGLGLVSPEKLEKMLMPGTPPLKILI